MPNIRVMNWNIQILSGTKAAIPGVAAALGQAIVDQQPDIVVLVEPRSVSGIAAITAVAAAASAAAANATDYTGWLPSYQTGKERYGFLIRDLNQVRPIVVATGPAGYKGNYLENLDENTFTTWPNTFAAAANAYPAPAPALRPYLPLIELYAGAAPANRKRKRFGGQVLGPGFAQGLGFRMPCLAMFSIVNGTGAAPYLLAIVASHLGAVRGGGNALGRGQVAQFKYTHIAQKFALGAALPNGGYINLDGAAAAVSNVMFTGDFNVDFLQNTPGGGVAGGNHRALVHITPTLQGAGTAGPPALNAAPGATPPVPFVVPPGTLPLISTAIPDLALRAGITATGTMLAAYDASAPPTTMAATRGPCFDNFFYGGADLSAHDQTLAAPDAGLTINMPGLVITGGGPTAANSYNVGGAWVYQMARGKKNAANAPNLNPGALGALGFSDMLIGARFLSDHVPSVVQFNLP